MIPARRPVAKNTIAHGSGTATAGGLLVINELAEIDVAFNTDFVPLTETAAVGV